MAHLRRSTLVLVLLSFASLAQEAETVSEKHARAAFHPHGPMGLFRTYSAETPESSPTTLGVGIHVGYLYLTDFPINGTDIERIDGRAALSWTPKKNLEFFLSGAGFSSNDNDSSVLLQQLGNLNFGLKWVEDLSNRTSLGVLYEGDLRRPLFDRDLSRYPFSHTGMMVGTLRFDAPIKLHFNAGFRFDDSEDLVFGGLTERDASLLEILGKNAFVGGIGLEGSISDVNLSVEYSTEQTLKTANVGYLGNPQRVTFGLRYFPPFNPKLSFGFATHVGAFATRKADRLYKEPDYSFIAGVTYLLGRQIQEVAKPVVSDTPPVKQTIVVGKVTEAKTGLPVSSALISVCQEDASPLVSDPKTGEYRSYPVLQQDCVIKVKHPEFTDYYAKLALNPQQHTHDIALERVIAPQGYLSISVKDTDGRSLPADVSFPEIPSAQTVKTNDQGKTRMKLPEGKYLVEVKAQGKKLEQKIFEIIGGQETTGEYILAPGTARLENQRIVITRQVQFDAGKASIKEESKLILDEVVAILNQHAEIRKLEVGGHTDAVGAPAINKKLSLRRAQAVVNYLTAAGISRTRLVAQGYGQEQPIASNASSEGRLANRRVEFRVLSR